MSEDSVLQPARDLMGTGDWDGAARWLRQADRSRWSPATAGEAAVLELYCTTETDDDLIRELRRLLRSGRHDLGWLHAVSDKLLHDQEYAAAELVLETTTRQYPNEWQPWFDLSVCFYEMERTEESLQACDRALALNPREGELLLHRVVCLEELGRLPEAIAACQEYLEVEPDDDEAWGSLARLHTIMGDYGAADAVFVDAAERFPGEPFPRFMRAVMLMGEPGPERARRVAEAARADLQVDDVEWRRALMEGLLADAEGRSAEAWSALHQALDLALEPGAFAPEPHLVAWAALDLARRHPDLPDIEAFIDSLFAIDPIRGVLTPAVCDAINRLGGPPELRARLFLVTVSGELPADEDDSEPYGFYSCLEVTAKAPARARMYAVAFETRRGGVNVKSVKCERGPMVENAPLGVGRVYMQRVRYALMPDGGELDW